MSTLSLTALCLTWASLGWGYGMSGGGQPTQQVLRITADGDWELHSQITKQLCFPETYTVTVKVPYEVEKQVQEDGKLLTKRITQYKEVQRQQTRTRTQNVCEQYGRRVVAESIKAYEMDGRKIPLADLQKRLKGDTLVVVNTGSDKLPDYYASVFKPGTIVIGQVQLENQPGHGPLPQPVVPGALPPTTQVPTDNPFRFVSFQPNAPVGNDTPKFPPTPAPTLVFAARDGADGVKIRQFSESKIPVAITVAANDSAVAPQEQITAMSTLRHSETTSLPWSSVRVSTPDNRDLPIDRVKERLGSGEQTVLMSADGKLVDEFWLQNVKLGVLVLRGFQFAMPMPMPTAMPVPVQSGEILPAPRGVPAQPAPPPQAVQPQ